MFNSLQQEQDISFSDVMILNSINTHTGGADQVVGVGPGHVSVMSHAAHHHHRLPPGSHDLNLGVGLPVLGRALA